LSDVAAFVSAIADVRRRGARSNISIFRVVFSLSCPQVLNILTKINKGTVEIVAPVELVKAGDKVGSSEAALLTKLNIRPFSDGLIITHVRTKDRPLSLVLGTVLW